MKNNIFDDLFGTASKLDKYIKKIDEYAGIEINNNGWTSVTSMPATKSHNHSNTIANQGNLSSASDDVDALKVTGDANVDGKLTVDGQDVGEFMRSMKDRFLIIEANFKKHEQYPALKDAYEKYKLIESLLRDDEPNNK